MYKALSFTLLFLLTSPALAQAATPDTAPWNGMQCERNDPNATIKACTALIASSSTPSPVLYQAYLYRGYAFRQEGLLNKDIADQTSAMSLVPQAAKPYIDRGELYDQMGSDELAISDYTRAMSLAPSASPILFVLRSVAYDHAKQYDRAISDASTVLASIRDPQIYFVRGTEYSDRGWYYHAISDLAEAIRLSPDVEGFYINRSFAFEKLHLFSQSIRDDRKAILLRPADPEAWNNICSSRANTGKLQTALADCNRALQLLPGAAFILDSRGFVFVKMRRYGAAMADYEAALRVNPRLADALYGLGVCERESGSATKARQDIAESRRINPHIVSDFGV